MPYIVDIKAREILDSRGNPTVEVELELESGVISRASVPSGASTGLYEAVELRDKDKLRFLGKGVLKAVSNVNDIIAPEIIGMDVRNQAEIDKMMIDLDGTKNKSKLGANAILAVSVACCKAAADYSGLPLYQYIGGVNSRILPTPMMNIINGGMHACNNLDFQEFMIIPNASTFKEALRMSNEVFHSLKKVLADLGLNTNVGDEGGFAPNLNNNEQAFDLIIEAIKKASYKPGHDFFLAIDVAASTFYKKDIKKYIIQNKEYSVDELIEYYKQLTNKYPIVSIEDPLDECDFEGFSKLTKEIGKKTLIVGDDLYVTNIERLTKGIELKSSNSILIKINQIGTLTETFDCIELAKSSGFKAIVSHRSGETEDTTIADISVGMKTAIIKTGSMSRTDRIAKYNQLLRIEEALGEQAVFKGIDAFKR